MRSFKDDFPIFKQNPHLVYLDSSATSQKPQVVIDCVTDFYQQSNSNIHRGIYDLSQKATDMFEMTREKVGDFIGANSSSEVVFTSGTTEAINLVAFGWGKKYLRAGDIVVLSEMEHHSNIVPWLRLKEEIGIELLFISITKEFLLDYQSISIEKLKKVKLVSLTHVSNVLGTINPIKAIISFLKTRTKNIKFLVDAAQSIPHLSIDVNNLDCDFLVFSSHKMFGPSGVGVLWTKRDVLELMDPLLVGSHMIKKVTKKEASWADIPDRFESGTRNIEGVIGLGSAVDYLRDIGAMQIEKYEQELTAYALDLLQQQKDIILFGPKSSQGRLGVFSFILNKIHPHDVAEILNRDGIAVRAGHHCAQPLMQVLGTTATVRVSLSLYNTMSDIDRLIQGLETVYSVFKM